MMLSTCFRSLIVGFLTIAPRLVAMDAQLLESIPAEKEHSQILGQQLLIACAAGDEEKVTVLLKNPETDVNYRLPYAAMKFSSFTPLMIALAYERPSIVPLLLKDKRLDVTLTNKNDNDALHMAVRQPACLKLLLQYQQDGKFTPPLAVNARCCGERTALYTAFEGGWWQSALQISNFPGVDPNICARGCDAQFPINALTGAPCLNFNVPVEDRNEHSGNHEMLCRIFFNLIERGMCVEARPKHQKTPFDHSFNPQHMGSVVWPLLCAFGAKATEEERRGFFMVSSCDEKQNQDGVSHHLWTTLGRGRQLYIRFAPGQIIGTDSFGFTPCMILAALGDSAIALIAPLNPRVVNAKTYNGWRALHFAAYNGYAKMLEYFRSLPAVDVCAKTDSGMTVCALARLGADVRFKATGQVDKAAVDVCEDFNKRRMATCLALLKVAQEGGFNLPAELLTRFVNSYRF